jgi:hypothetical protein
MSEPGVAARPCRVTYAILCYHDEKVTCAWSKEHDDAVMAKLAVVQERLAREGKLGPVAAPAADDRGDDLRNDREPPLVLDGPFAETKEQLLGFYVVDCDSLEEALASRASSGRPIRAAPTRSARSASTSRGGAGS